LKFCRKKFKSQYIVAPHNLSFALASWVNADVKLQQLTPCLWNTYVSGCFDNAFI